MRLGRFFFACLIPLILATALRADELDATISACGQPALAFRTTDGRDDVEYKFNSTWLKFEKVGDQRRWYAAFDDRTKRELSREEVMKRLPCTVAMLKANTSPTPAASSPDSYGAPSATSGTSSANGYGWAFLVAILLGLMVWGTSRRKPDQKFASDELVKCPKCFSSQIHADRRGWRLLSGFMGSGKVVITCLRCGHKFRPGRGV